MHYLEMTQKISWCNDPQDVLCMCTDTMFGRFFLQATELTTETTNYEEQEQELMMVCVEELCKCYSLVSFYSY